MNMFSTGGKFYLAFCLATCGYFTTAAIKSWPGPSFGSGSSGGHSYFHGWSGGRSSGGFGGGGK